MPVLASMDCHTTDDETGSCKWRVTLPPTQGSLQESFTITATSQKHGSIKISDVLFGDVWICSGQSNMQFTVSQVSQRQHK